MLEIMTNYHNLEVVLVLLFIFGALNSGLRAVFHTEQNDASIWPILAVSNLVEALMFGKLGWDAIQVSGIDGSPFVWTAVAVGTAGLLINAVLTVSHTLTCCKIVPVYLTEQQLREAGQDGEMPVSDVESTAVKDCIWLEKRDHISVLAWL